MRPLVAAYATYSGTKKAYCAQHDLNTHTFDYWRKRVAAAEAATQHPPTKSPKQNSFVELPPLPTSAALYTLHLPDGKRLELPLQTPIAILTQLLQITL